MNDENAKASKQPLEGEGSYSAAKAYNQHLAEALEQSDIEDGAELARRAVEGPENEELAQAAEQAKRGPQPKKRADEAR